MSSQLIEAAERQEKLELANILEELPIDLARIVVSYALEPSSKRIQEILADYLFCIHWVRNSEQNIGFGIDMVIFCRFIGDYLGLEQERCFCEESFGWRCTGRYQSLRLVPFLFKYAEF